MAMPLKANIANRQCCTSESSYLAFLSGLEVRLNGSNPKSPTKNKRGEKRTKWFLENVRRGYSGGSKDGVVHGYGGYSLLPLGSPCLQGTIRDGANPLLLNAVRTWCARANASSQRGMHAHCPRCVHVVLPRDEVFVVRMYTD